MEKIETNELFDLDEKDYIRRLKSVEQAIEWANDKSNSWAHEYWSEVKRSLVLNRKKQVKDFLRSISIDERQKDLINRLMEQVVYYKSKAKGFK